MLGSDLPHSIDAVHHVHTSPTQDIMIMTCDTDFAVPDLISELAHSGGYVLLPILVSLFKSRKDLAGYTIRVVDMVEAVS